MRDALIAEMESHLSYANYFEWNANINGVIIQLRTNVSHLYDFWMENWYPAQLEADLEPHGIIYAVDNVAGREPRMYYNSETKTGVLVNADNYGPLRSLAVGLVSDVSERLFGVHSIRGMVADIDGRGVLLIGPKGTKKTELFFSLLRDPRFKLHSNDTVFARYSGGRAVADCVERKLFMATNSVEFDSDLAPLFDNSKNENIIVHKDACANETCLQLDDCRLDRGSPFCYTASKKASALLDPYWIGGPAKHVKRTSLRWLFLLRNDNISPPFVKTETEDALRIMEQGEILGAQREPGPARNQPFYNPHLLVMTPERMELERSFFRRLLESTECYLFNSGVASPEDLKKIVTGDTQTEPESD
jgi:hypothetical protein